MNDFPEFRERLQMLRKKQGISCQVMSQLCGLHSDAIRRYEKGEDMPRITQACNIADFGGVSLDWLLGRV